MNNHHLTTWVKIADSIDGLSFSAEGFVTIELNNKKICITHAKGILYACASNCPHAGGDLSEGYVDAIGNIVCPVHHYKFSMSTGRNVSGEGYFLKVYAIENRAEGIFICFP